MRVLELIGGDIFCVKNYDGLEMQKDSEGQRIAVVSTETPDGVGDIIRQGKNKKGQGWLLDRFNRAPVLLWSHDIQMPNISGPETRAKVRRMDGFGRSLVLQPLSFDAEDPAAAMIEGKVDRGVIRESSVGFIGKEWRELENGGREFFEQELFEVSFVNRGMNPDTDTLTKTLLSLFPAARLVEKVEDGGGSEIVEMKQELMDMRDEIAVLHNVIKALGDRFDEAAMAEEKKRSAIDEQRKMARYLLDRLEKAGMIHP